MGRCVPVARVQRRPKQSGEVPWRPSGERIQRNGEHSFKMMLNTICNTMECNE